VLVAQVGIPVPAIPLLLAAGALAGTDRLDLTTTVALALVASLLGDAAWFLLGRHRGNRVLGLLCRLSLEPEACVMRTRSAFARNQDLTLLIAKFVPGLSTMAPPLAGMSGMSWARFLLVDALGALLWILAFVLPGYALSGQIETLAGHAAVTGTWLLGLLVVTVLAFVLVKLVRRRAFLRGLRVARIQPMDLHQQLSAGSPPFLVDLRHPDDFATDPRVIPGSLHVVAEELERHHETIPRDRDVVLYCT
jgi:membrane protein DedA with SNARE-associated domain